MIKKFYASKRMISISLALLMVVSLFTPMLGTTKAAIVGDTYDPDKILSGTNWMSLISDERALNEINIPGSHDSAMAKPDHNSFPGALYPSYAKTQNKSIRDQLNFGIRMLDIRMTNKRDTKISGNNTYIVHGQKNTIFMDLRYYATKDAGFAGNFNYTLSDLMGDVTEFLKNNPSETVLLELGYEYKSGDESETYSKAQGLLNEYLTKINSSTGKSYIYTQDGNKIITSMPNMGDVRGQIVIMSKNTSALGYGMQYSAPNGYSGGTVAGVPFLFENHYEADASHKLDYVKTFFNGGMVPKWPSSGTKAYPDDRSNANTYNLSKDILSHTNKGNIVTTAANVAWASWEKLGDNPDEIADKVNPWLYGDNGLFNTRGKLYGWVYSDFVNWVTARKLYMTNFPTGKDGLAYKKVTYKIDPNDSSKDKTYMVLAGESITVDKCDNLKKDFSTFAGWSTSSGIKKPGEKVKITDNTTLTANYVMTWKDVQNYINDLANHNKTGEITLNGDLVATAIDETIVIPEGYNVTIDLNGHDISGTENSKDRKTYFSVHGNLSIINRKDTTSKIMKAKGYKGGAFFVDSGGQLLLGSNINVTDNTAAVGGGIYLNPNANLSLGDVQIKSNKATGGVGGGIFCDKNAKITMTSSLVVTDNSSRLLSFNHPKDNIYFVKGDVVPFLITSKMGSGANIGISTNIDDVRFGEIPIAEDTNNGEYVSASYEHFLSDSDDYKVYKGITDSNKIYMSAKAPSTVTFDLNGGTGNVPSQTIVNGGKATRPTGVVREGYTLINWLEGKYPYNFKDAVRSDKTLKANWIKKEFIVEFLVDGVKEFTRIVGYNDIVYSLPIMGSKSGYDFGGWWTSEGAQFTEGTPVTRNMKVYGRWNPKTVELIFESNGGDNISKSSVNYKDKPSRPSNPTNGDKVFAGWYTDNGTFKDSFDFNEPMTRDTTIYAKWEEPTNDETYIIAFDSMGGDQVYGAQEISENDTAVNPGIPTKQNNTFTGWYTDEACEDEFDFDEPIIDDMMLYAGWKQDSYKVTFDSNGGTSVPTQTVAEGEQAVEQTPTKRGQNFAGWYTDEAFTDRYDFSKPVTSFLRLHAKWNKDIMIVSFDKNYGETSSDSDADNNDADVMYAYYDGVVDEPDDPVREGYEFVGWYKEPECIDKYDFDDSVTEDMRLYAKWKKLPSVTFDTDGGSEVAPIKALYVGKLIDLNATKTTKEGYDFKGWYKKADDVTVDEAKEIIEELPGFEEYIWIDGDNVYYMCGDYYFADDEDTLKARWEPIEHTVSFYDDDHVLISTQKVLDGKTATKPDDPYEVDYEFVDWYADEALTVPFDFNTVIKSDVNVYSGWQEIVYDVTFDSNDGTSVEVQKVKGGEDATVPTNPQKEGQIFEGWYELISDDSVAIETFKTEYPELVDFFVYKDGAMYMPYDFEEDVITPGTKLVALWSLAPNQTDKASADGLSGDTATTNASVNTSANAPIEGSVVTSEVAQGTTVKVKPAKTGDEWFGWVWKVFC